jgi:hypothetical protein
MLKLLEIGCRVEVWSPSHTKWFVDGEVSGKDGHNVKVRYDFRKGQYTEKDIEYDRVLKLLRVIKLEKQCGACIGKGCVFCNHVGYDLASRPDQDLGTTSASILDLIEHGFPVTTKPAALGSAASTVGVAPKSPSQNLQHMQFGHMLISSPTRMQTSSGPFSGPLSETTAPRAQLDSVRPSQASALGTVRPEYCARNQRGPIPSPNHTPEQPALAPASANSGLLSGMEVHGSSSTHAPPKSAVFFDISSDDGIAAEVHADQRRQLGVFEHENGGHNVGDSASDRDDVYSCMSDASEDNSSDKGREYHSEDDEYFVDENAPDPGEEHISSDDDDDAEQPDHDEEDLDSDGNDDSEQSDCNSALSDNDSDSGASYGDDYD